VQRGKVVLGSPLLFGVTSLLLALLGVAAGAVQAVKPIETLVDVDAVPLHGTSWSAGITALLFVAGISAALGGIVYWAPKLLGARIHEGGARLVALLLLVGGAVGGLATLVAGLLGEPQSAGLAAVDNRDAIETLDLLATAGDGILALAGIVVVLLLLKATFGTVEAPGDDPWSGHTLEWATASPPVPGNFASLPKISSEAPLYDARHGQETDA
jgi:heme/copper-type cytochrome/quinol oxidase subunit 1